MDSGSTVTFSGEIFPPPRDFHFSPLFAEHAMEVRGRPFHLDYRRYDELERWGRLVFIVARESSPAPQKKEADPLIGDRPVGYCCGWWYRDLHFPERVGADDLWFVLPAYRGKGIGRTLKQQMHEQLKTCGCVRVYENVRSAYDHPKLMADLGYELWGTRWGKTLI